MGRTIAKTSQGSQRKQKPALNPEARENQLIARAVDLAEQQLMNGTASSQVITHFLKLGSSREKLEKESKVLENQLLQAKAEYLQSQKHSEVLYKDALDAFKLYGGHNGHED